MDSANVFNEFMISKQNTEVQLTGEQKNFLNKMAFYSGNHPHQRVRKVRYHYQQKQMRKSKKVKERQ